MSMKAESLRAEMPTSRATPTESPDLAALFDGHIAREFADQDVDATMETMVPEPYVHCVATLAGGVGGREVRRFYSEHFINQIPKDAKVTPISRTIGKDQVVDELIVSFTHSTQWDYLLPGIRPTGKKVELPHVVVMKFENGKVAHEHVWWDQASLLVQVGLLDPGKLPVVGVEQARKLQRLGAAHNLSGSELRSDLAPRLALKRQGISKDCESRRRYSTMSIRSFKVNAALIGAEAPEDILKSVLAALNQGNISRAVEQFADHFTFNDYALDLKFTEKERLSEFFQKSRELFPDAAVEVVSAFESGDLAVAEWNVTATQMIPGPTRYQFPVLLRGSTIVQIENRRVTRWSDYYDQAKSRRVSLGAFFEEWIDY